MGVAWLAGRLCSEKESQTRRENGPVPVAAGTGHTHLRGLHVASEPGFSQIFFAKFCFSFPTPPWGSCTSCSDSPGFHSLWIAHGHDKAPFFSHPGPDQMEGPPKLKYRYAAVITGSPLQSCPLVKVPSPSAGAPARGWRGRARVLGFFPRSDSPQASHHISFCLSFLIWQMDREI